MIKGKNILVLSLVNLLFLVGNAHYASANENNLHLKKETQKTIIEGVINNGGNRQLILSRIQFGGKEEHIDSTMTDKNGHFKFITTIGEVGFYRMQFMDSSSRKKYIPLTMLPGDHVKVEATNSDDFNYTPVYKGTSWAKPLNGFMIRLNKFVDWQKNRNKASAVKEKAPQKTGATLKQEIDDYVAQQIKNDPANPGNM